jgi:hypothetical protein
MPVLVHVSVVSGWCRRRRRGIDARCHHCCVRKKKKASAVAEQSSNKPTSTTTRGDSARTAARRRQTADSEHAVHYNAAWYCTVVAVLAAWQRQRAKWRARHTNVCAHSAARALNEIGWFQQTSQIGSRTAQQRDTQTSIQTWGRGNACKRAKRTACDLGVLVAAQARVEDGVRDLIADLLIGVGSR